MGSCNYAEWERDDMLLQICIKPMLSMTHLYALIASEANVIVSCLNYMRGYIQEKVIVTLLLPWTHQP